MSPHDAAPAGGKDEAPATRWRLDLCWDGRRFSGWQWQPDERTIQGAVEAALVQVLDGESARVKASGRTDAGVHALHQVAAFDAVTPRTPRGLVGGLNHYLPADVACLDARPAPPGFDPRGWTRGKTYRYRILTRRSRCPFRRGQVWHRHGELDVDAMQAAIAHLRGRHDWTSFRAQGCAAAHPVRVLADSRVVVHQDRDELWLEFVGHGFLRHQVRIMVGTLVDVGRGRLAPDDVARIRDARDRRVAGPTVPAEGLWLVEVHCGDTPREG